MRAWKILDALAKGNNRSIDEVVTHAILHFWNTWVQVVPEGESAETKPVKPELPPKPLRRDEKPRPNEPRS